MAHFSKINFYLMNILSVFIGMNILLNNSKESPSGFIIVSVLLLVLPGIFILLSNKPSKFSSLKSIIIIILPLILINYIYIIRMGVPVGYEDTHQTIYQSMRLFDESGIVIFQRALAPSFNYVGFYIVLRNLSLITGLNIIQIASMIPQFLNLITLPSIYAIANRLFSNKAALIAIIFYGWQNEIIIFGQELRTQTAGTLLLFSILFVLTISNRIENKSDVSIRIVLMLLLLGMVTTAIVGILFTFLILIGFLSSDMILSGYFKWQNKSNINLFMVLIFLLFLLFYLFYIGNGFSTLFSALHSQIDTIETSTKTTAILSSQEPIYGYFSQYAYRFFWFLFLVFSIQFIYNTLRDKNLSRANFFLSLCPMMLFWFFDTFGGPLSPTRIYVVMFILLTIIVSSGLSQLHIPLRKPVGTYISQIILILVIATFSVASIMENPNYIVGNTQPIRSIAPIDNINYWDADFPQYSAISFISEFSKSKTIHTHMGIKRYYFLDIWGKHNLILRDDFNIFDSYLNKFDIIGKDQMILLQDRFYGKPYFTRHYLPPVNSYNQFDEIYDNIDYLVFIH